MWRACNFPAPGGRVFSNAQRQVSLKPEAGHGGDFVDHAGLGEEMIGALNDFDHRFFVHCAAGMAVVSDVNRVLGSHDHEGGGVHVLQLILGEIRPATAGNHGAHELRAAGGGDHGGSRAGAGTEEADVHAAGPGIFREPIDHGGQPGGDPVEVLRIIR